ncbi:MAG: hypothetical protein EA380_06395 [Phycisphaeraceae bacterium]|nr:MAG: hypothetical protein EA380_06395 [Phycisphaeraceae bacterium]
MMRSVWLVISSLALANMLALVMFFGWLAGTERLSSDRIETVRSIFVETVSETEERLRKEEREAERLAGEEAEQAKVGTPPITAEQRMLIIDEHADLVNHRIRRTQRETEDLIRLLDRQLRELNAEQAAFEAERDQWLAQREAIREMEGSEQFRKALTIYETLRPDAAANLLQQLIDGGDIDQAVMYLSRMKSRTASRIIGVIEGRDARLAADLLERLRALGIDPRSLGDG